MEITIVGAGYVGFSLGLLLARRHEICFLTKTEAKTQLINEGRCPIRDEDAEQLLRTETLHFRATTDRREAMEGAEFIIVAVPTDYDAARDGLDTSIVREIVQAATEINPEAVIVIRSTVPIGFTEKLRKEFKNTNILFSPEFLREGRAIRDTLCPSRIVVGADLNDAEQTASAQRFAQLLREAAFIRQGMTLLMSPSEAEAVKLFSNAYLAMRVAFFNELDTCAAQGDMNSRRVVEGVCADPRIGDFYNSPSFGYGGYCLTKDTRELANELRVLPTELIGAINAANETRKRFIAGQVLDALKGIERKTGRQAVLGIYRLTAKKDSDNCRESSVLGVIERLLDAGVTVRIYEPLLNQEKQFMGCAVEGDLGAFKQGCDVILANRMDVGLDDVRAKVLTRDLFYED